jgi:lipopolysaccharide transport system permease protein
MAEHKALVTAGGGVDLAPVAREKPLSAVRIRPPGKWPRLDLAELWEYRDLLYFLTWRDIKIRYKQTVLGGIWAVLQPLFMMVVFTLVFGQLAKIPSDGIPYPIFNFAALVPWAFFAKGLTASSESLVGSANLLKKVYFPRLIIPFSAVFSGALDFLLAFVILLGMMAWFGMAPTIHILWLPMLALLCVVASIGVGLWFSAMNVQFRDVRHMIPFLAQAWMYASPVAYPSSLLKEPWRTLYGLNPMCGVIEGFRWALLGAENAPHQVLLLSWATALIVFVSGLFYFRHMEKTFADVV